MPKPPDRDSFFLARDVATLIEARDERIVVGQVLAALLYGASGVMKVFMFDEISKDVPSFGALPRGAWLTLGIVELICVVGLILPAALRWQPNLTVAAAVVLAVESLVFVGVHIKYGEIVPIVMSVVLGLLMAFIAYGRLVLSPIS